MSDVFGKLKSFLDTQKEPDEDIEQFWKQSTTPTIPDAVKEEFKSVKHPYNLSPTGRQFLMESEGFKDTAYQDSAGIWTIGFGSTRLNNKPVSKGMKISKEEGFRQKESYVKELQKAIDNSVTAPLTQNQYDALISLGYNIGVNGLANSTLVSKINSGDQITEEDFLSFNKAKNKGTGKKEESEGLSKRRKREFEIFSQVE